MEVPRSAYKRGRLKDVSRPRVEVTLGRSRTGSWLLRTLVLGLITTIRPRRSTSCFVDFKGGAPSPARPPGRTYSSAGPLQFDLSTMPPAHEH